jgi:NADP-dependent 3-hydroxy acid dehydrogenase YdfG
VLGIVNNVGLAKHETIGNIDPEVFATVMNVRPALQLTQALLPGMRAARFGRVIARISFKLRSGEGRAGEYHAHNGDRARSRGYYRKCRCPGPN